MLVVFFFSLNFFFSFFFFKYFNNENCVCCHCRGWGGVGGMWWSSATGTRQQCRTLTELAIVTFPMMTKNNNPHISLLCSVVYLLRNWRSRDFSSLMWNFYLSFTIAQNQLKLKIEDIEYSWLSDIIDKTIFQEGRVIGSCHFHSCATWHWECLGKVFMTHAQYA